MEEIVPKINYLDYKNKCEKLDQAINSKKVKNVAISGIFGSGKSSLIQTYEKAYNNKIGKKIVNKFTKKKREDYENLNNSLEVIDKEDPLKKSLFVSLANFNITSDKENYNKNNPKNKSNDNSTKGKDDNNNTNSDSDDKDNNTDDKNSQKNKLVKDLQEMDLYKERRKKVVHLKDSEIEKSLLQQFVFNVDSKVLPDSKIKRVKPKRGLQVSTYVFLILTLIIGVVFVVNKFDLLWSFNNAVDKVFLSIVSFVKTL